MFVEDEDGMTTAYIGFQEDFAKRLDHNLFLIDVLSGEDDGTQRTF